MRLTCISRYCNRGVVYNVGDTIDLPDAEAAALLADSPGSFAVEAPPAPDEPVTDDKLPTPIPPMDGEAPMNRAISRAPRRKSQE